MTSSKNTRKNEKKKKSFHKEEETKGVSLRIYYPCEPADVCPYEQKVDYIPLMWVVLCYMEVKILQLRRRCNQTTE